MDVARLHPRRTSSSIARLSVAVVIGSIVGCAQTKLFGPTTAVSFMKVVETEPDPNVRYRAYQKLGTQGVYDDSSQKARAARLLLTRLNPTLEPLASRAAICRSLGEIGDPVARDALIRLLRDPDPQLKSEAIRALGKVGKPEDATVLMQIMTLDNDPDCKVAAIEGLGLLKIPDIRTEGYLVQAMDDDNPGIRLAALDSLRKITGQDLGVHPEPWRKYVMAKNTPAAKPPVATVDPSSRRAAATETLRELPPMPAPAGLPQLPR
jgi:HEAT repeat protein